MNENHLSTKVETRLKNFFNNAIDAKDMAKTIRQVNYILSLCALRESENIESEIKNMDDNFYWLNRLAEVLDPYLDID